MDTRVGRGTSACLAAWRRAGLSAYDTNGYQLRYLAQPQALSTQNIQHLLGRYDYPPVIEQTVEKSEPEPYSPWSTLRPHNWLPLVYIDDARTQIGALTFGSDALGRHSYQLTATWDFDNELADANLVYQYDNRWMAALSSSHDFDKMTVDGRSDYRITRDDYFVLQRNHIVTAFEDQLSLHAGGVLDKESLVSQPDFASMIAFRESNETLAGACVDV